MVVRTWGSGSVARQISSRSACGNPATDVELAVLELARAHGRRHRRRSQPRLDREGPLPGQRLVQALPERVDVEHARVRLLAAEDLRREVRERPDVAGRGQRFPRLSHGDAEVDELDPAPGREDDVRGLDVAVEDAGGVRVLERGGEGREGGERLRDGEGAALQALLERLAVRELHGQVRQPEAGIQADGHDAHDGGVGERAQRLRLAHEPHARLAVRRGLEDLEGRDHAVAHARSARERRRPSRLRRGGSSITQSPTRSPVLSTDVPSSGSLRGRGR